MSYRNVYDSRSPEFKKVLNRLPRKFIFSSVLILLVLNSIIFLTIKLLDSENTNIEVVLIRKPQWTDTIEINSNIRIVIKPDGSMLKGDTLAIIYSHPTNYQHSVLTKPVQSSTQEQLADFISHNLINSQIVKFDDLIKKMDSTKVMLEVLPDLDNAIFILPELDLRFLESEAVEYISESGITVLLAAQNGFFRSSKKFSHNNHSIRYSLRIDNDTITNNSLQEFAVLRNNISFDQASEIQFQFAESKNWINVKETRSSLLILENLRQITNLKDLDTINGTLKLRKTKNLTDDILEQIKSSIYKKGHSK